VCYYSFVVYSFPCNIHSYVVIFLFLLLGVYFCQVAVSSRASKHGYTPGGGSGAELAKAKAAAFMDPNAFTAEAKFQPGQVRERKDVQGGGGDEREKENGKVTGGKGKGIESCY
jgi:hypothetical protein